MEILAFPVDIFRMLIQCLPCHTRYILQLASRAYHARVLKARQPLSAERRSLPALHSTFAWCNTRSMVDTGDVVALRWVLSRRGRIYNARDFASRAIRLGQIGILELLKPLLGLSLSQREEFTESFIRSGHVHLFGELSRMGVLLHEWTQRTLRVAVGCGDIPMILLAHKQGVHYKPMDLAGVAARSGQVCVLQWLYARGERFDEYHHRLYTDAINSDKLATLQYLESIGLHPTSSDVVYARAYGRKAILDWLLAVGADQRPGIW